MEHLWVNGNLLRVVQAGPAQAPAVILSNSLGADLSMWDELAKDLVRYFRVIRMDTLGHGGSAAAAGDYSLNQLADDVLAVMDSLNIRRAHFIGLSLGGMIGQVLGATSGSRFESLTLCATFADAPRQMWADRVDAVRATGVAPLVDGTIERWFTPAFRETETKTIAAVRKMITDTSVNGYAGCAAAIRDMDLTGVPEQIKIPTLVIAAAQDPSATPEAMKALHARIPGAHYAEIAGAAHLFPLEKPDETSRLILSFLQENRAAHLKNSVGSTV